MHNLSTFNTSVISTASYDRVSSTKDTRQNFVLFELSLKQNSKDIGSHTYNFLIFRLNLAIVLSLNATTGKSRFEKQSGTREINSEKMSWNSDTKV